MPLDGHPPKFAGSSTYVGGWGRDQASPQFVAFWRLAEA